MLIKGSKVYIPCEIDGWILADVIDILEEDKISVQFFNKKNQNIENLIIKKDSCLLSNEGYSKVDTGDLCDLIQLNEATVLHTLKDRYSKSLVYSKVKDVLISVNPYTWIDIYNNTYKEQYNNISYKDLSPHIFMISSRCFYDLKNFKRDQSIIVSGESGSGKTEAVKLLMFHLSYLSKCEETDIVNKILNANRILEYLGNSKTARNDNSSRYGKFISLLFHPSQDIILGSSIKTYLLEKSRVVKRSNIEKNFHIFYQLFSGSREVLEKIQLSNKTPNDFNYLFSDHPLTFFETLDNVIEAFEIGLKINKDQILDLFKCFSAILYIGELNYIDNNDGFENEAKLNNQQKIREIVSNLLGINVTDLENALTKRSIEVRGQKIEMELSDTQKNITRDSLAAELYSKLFNFLVQYINKIANYQDQDKNNQEINESLIIYNDLVRNSKKISLLDIFGFESLECNGLEQLLINYANEALHKQFVHSTILEEQEEYKREELEIYSFEFPRINKVINLFENRNGIIESLHELSKLSSSTEQSLINSTKNLSKENDSIEISKCQKKFSILHFAGKVTYESKNMLKRNNDMPLAFLNNWIENSNNFIFKQLNIINNDSKEAISSSSSSSTSSSTSSTSSSFIPPPTCLNHNNSNNKSLIRVQTLSKIFKSQLSSVIKEIESASVKFVKCLKPNNKKLENLFNPLDILEQLKYSGIIEAALISRSGHPCRLKKSEFYEKFYRIYHLDVEKKADFKKSLTNDDIFCIIKNIIEKVNLSPSKISPNTFVLKEKEIIYGKTKIFLSNELILLLNSYQQNFLIKLKDKIYNFYLRYITRKKYLDLLVKIIKIQSIIRKFLKLKQYYRVKHYIITIQANIRRYQHFKYYQKARSKVIKIQSVARRRKCQLIFYQLLEERLRREEEERLRKEEEERLRREEEERLRREEEERFRMDAIARLKKEDNVADVEKLSKEQSENSKEQSKLIIQETNNIKLEVESKLEVENKCKHEISLPENDSTKNINQRFEFLNKMNDNKVNKSLIINKELIKNKENIQIDYNNQINQNRSNGIKFPPNPHSICLFHNNKTKKSNESMSLNDFYQSNSEAESNQKTSSLNNNSILTNNGVHETSKLDLFDKEWNNYGNAKMNEIEYESKKDDLDDFTVEDEEINFNPLRTTISFDSIFSNEEEANFTYDSIYFNNFRNNDSVDTFYEKNIDQEEKFEDICKYKYQSNENNKKIISLKSPLASSIITNNYLSSKNKEEIIMEYLNENKLQKRVSDTIIYNENNNKCRKNNFLIIFQEYLDSLNGHDLLKWSLLATILIFLPSYE